MTISILTTVGILIIQLLLLSLIAAYIIKKWFDDLSKDLDNPIPNSPQPISSINAVDLHELVNIVTTENGDCDFIITMGDKTWKIVKRGDH